MKTSESTAKLTAALAKARVNIHHPKRASENPHLRNKFADLASVIDATLPALAAEGITVVQTVCSRVTEAGNLVAAVSTRMSGHGEFIEDTAELPVIEEKGLKLAQSLGSVITYLRRYGWSAITGTASEPDDDGNENQNPAPAPRQAAAPAKPAAKPPLTGPSTDEQLKRIAALIHTTGSDRDKFLKAYKIKDIPDLTNAQAVDAIAKLMQKPAINNPVAA